MPVDHVGEKDGTAKKLHFTKCGKGCRPTTTYICSPLGCNLSPNENDCALYLFVPNQYFCDVLCFSAQARADWIVFQILTPTSKQV